MRVRRGRGEEAVLQKIASPCSQHDRRGIFWKRRVAKTNRCQLCADGRLPSDRSTASLGLFSGRVEEFGSFGWGRKMSVGSLWRGGMSAQGKGRVCVCFGGGQCTVYSVHAPGCGF